MSVENTASLKVAMEVKNLSKSFKSSRGDVTIFEDTSFKIFTGEKIAVVGPSGSGKSTLLSLIGLLDNPTSGSIIIDGIDTAKLSENELADFRNKRIGFIFQGFELISPFTVRENISAPVEIGKKDLDKNKVSSLIEEVGLSHRSESLPLTLSGGEKQRVAIARAISNDPEIILADEPTGSLDRHTGEKVLSLLLDTVNQKGKTLIIITHDESIAKRMDRVFEIKDNSVHERI
jgi:putative ABC transport system ATP-binding protein